MPFSLQHVMKFIVDVRLSELGEALEYEEHKLGAIAREREALAQDEPKVAENITKLRDEIRRRIAAWV